MVRRVLVTAAKVDARRPGRGDEFARVDRVAHFLGKIGDVVREQLDCVALGICEWQSPLGKAG